MTKVFRKASSVIIIFVLVLTLFTSISASAAETKPYSDTVTVTFNANGGFTNSTRWLTPGETLGVLPTPTRANYVFLGWFTSITGGQEVTPDTLVPQSNTNYWARWAQNQSKTLSHTGSMMIIGLPPLTTNSNWITFNGNALPANAKVTSISVNTGTSTMSGAIIGNNLQVVSTARPNDALIMPWNGANNSVLANTTFFWNHNARAAYSIRWNGTVISGTLGNILNPNPTDAIRGYSNVKLTINYIVIP